MILGGHCYSQSLTLLDSAKINSPDLMAADKQGNIYATDIKGNVYKFDAELDNLLIYSPSAPTRITSIDPWQGLRIFIFYRDIQEFTLLNRFLDSPSNFKIQTNDVDFIIAATPSFDNKLWLLDQPSMSLLKYDYSNQKVEIRRPLDFLISKPFQQISLFTEYQNRIYLAGMEGELYVFDNLGNFLLKHFISGARWTGFFEDSLYYYVNGRIGFMDLYSFQSETIDLTLSSHTRGALRVADNFYFFSGGKIFRGRLQ